MEEIYSVKKLKNNEEFTITVPGSKSVTNRALMLAALAKGKCVLEGVLFSDDSRAFLDCLEKLGFEMEINEEIQTVSVVGLGGEIPNKNASINVRSAGTAARFLTVMLALAGGKYHLDSSEQMKKRPMEPLITMLRNAGIDIRCTEEEGHFPFDIVSQGLKENELTIDTNISSQFASAILMAGNIVKGGVKLTLTGDRIEGAYIKITKTMLSQFGVNYEQSGSVYIIKEGAAIAPQKYVVEPDVSAACYFWGIAAINNRKILVRRVRLDGMQGDLKFLAVLEKMGCKVEQTEQGVAVTGTDRLKGVSADMKDFSDQTMTLAVIAAFAEGVTEIKNIAHIRLQESDRLSAVVNELTRLGVDCSETKCGEEEGIRIVPGKMKPADIHTYDDHRIAMSFAMAGTKFDGVRILNPMCCRKTFENYFKVLDGITGF